MYLKLDNYTFLYFENRNPICVMWNLADLHEWPKDEELVNEVKSKLKSMGWNVELEQPQFASDEPYSDFYSTIRIVDNPTS